MPERKETGVIRRSIKKVKQTAKKGGQKVKKAAKKGGQTVKKTVQKNNKLSRLKAAAYFVVGSLFVLGAQVIGRKMGGGPRR